MRLFVICALLVVSLVSVSSAELLTTAFPLGQGKWGVLAPALQDSNVGNASGITLTSVGGYAGYGITDKLDLLISLGSSNMGGLGAGINCTLTGIGATLKYALLSEGKNLPVSVAVGAGYKSFSTKTTTPLGSTDVGNAQTGVAVGISKLIVPFIPYGGIAYKSTASGSATTSTQIDVTAGTAIAWSAKGAVYIEYTLQSINDKTGIGNYSSGQVGIGVGYAI